jgi:hypothetical protein
MGAAVSGEASMSADISALVELLREAEWAASDEWDSKCPWCENYEHSHREPGESRHQADCKYARVLAESATSSPARVQSEDVSLPNGSATLGLSSGALQAEQDASRKTTISRASAPSDAGERQDLRASGGEGVVWLPMTKDEHYWVSHAASLRSLSFHEYVVRAINASLRREGVDAVLLKESDYE